MKLKPLNIFVLILFLFLVQSAFSADYYWESPIDIQSDVAFFPQSIVSDEGYIFTAWQSYDDIDTELVSLYGSVSSDGTSWSDPFLLLEPFQYRGEDRVSIFTMAQDSRGKVILSLTESENSIAIYRLNTPGNLLEKISVIDTEHTSVVPRIFRRADNSLILFMTGSIILPNGSSALTIYYSLSEDGLDWNTVEHFIRDSELKQNFLPHYCFDNEAEYVVFQSLYTGSRNTYQIYLKTLDRGDENWSEEILVTSYDEYIEGENAEFTQFDNQRPHMLAENGKLYLAWERRLGRSMPQIQYGVFDKNAQPLEEIEQVSRGTYFTASPRIIRKNDETLVLWFDNRNNNQIILAKRNGIFWQSEVLSSSRGTSTYGRWIEYKDDLYVLWENISNDQRNITLLTPDKTAPAPILRTVNFTDRGRQSEDRAIISWRRPEDSSGILGFSYTWDNLPDTEPDKNIDFLDFRERTETFRAIEDGDWYFHIALIDYAGNWSETVHLRITRDTVPPDPVQFFKPVTDALGYLISNTFTLNWLSEDEHLGGYSYQFYFLGEDVDFIDPSTLDLPSPPSTVQTVSAAVQYNNRDNGHWALSVSAFDDVGNQSEPALLLFRTNKYIPVTYISDVKTVKDELERVVLTIIGRGFSVDGTIQRVLIDRDGKAPWDYEYSEDSYNVSSDRVIRGPAVEVFEEGLYFVGVEHPVRGYSFAQGQLKLDSTGTVRFGDFSYDYKTFWLPVEMARNIFSLNKIVFYMLILFLIAVCILSALQIRHILIESNHLEEDVQSIISGTPLKEEMKQERIKSMKQKGMGLRMKFILALLTLILAVILLISIFLGNYMINTQKISLSEGLYDKSALLLETLTTSARTYLPTQNRLELGLLPNTIRAMEEAVNTTISGQGANDPDSFDYIWSSNNDLIESFQEFPESISYDSEYYPAEWSVGEIEEFESKFRDGDQFVFEGFPEEERQNIYAILNSAGRIQRFEPGTTKIDDYITEQVLSLETEINERALELIGEQSSQLDQLSEDAVRLAVRGDRASLDELAVIQDTISRIETEINDKLSTVSNIVQTYPEFNVDTLSDENLIYTFYKPVVYRNKGRDSYFRGMVRLDVSIRSILDGIVETQNSILRITIIISLLALAGGIAGAMLLAQTMINPIRKLVQGVEKVRDTQDKSKLKDYTIKTGTKDELFELATTFNQMTEGLVAAAVANKSLILGKEIQKKFLPLDPVPQADRKYTTGEEVSDFIHFFGYYEGAKGVSGDYFDYKKLDEKHYATIKCDISGKDIPASLIMVQVATLFKDYFSKLNIKRDGIHLEKLVNNINDLIAQINFQGKFAALIVSIINIETGKCWICHAGDRIFYTYDGVQQKVIKHEMEASPAAGMFSTEMIGNTAFKQITFTLKRTDILFLFTDGIEEAKRTFRTREMEVITCDGSCDSSIVGDEEFVSHESGSTNEELGLARIEEIMEAALQKKAYQIYQYHQPNTDIKLSFDFTKSAGDMKDTVLALIAVEKVFRLYPDPSAGPDDRIRIDNKVDDYLKEHFDQYRDYFRYPIKDDEYPEYTYYSHLKEDPQYDDLTILGILKK